MERHYDEYQLTIRYRIAFRALLLTLALILANGLVNTFHPWAPPLLQAVALLLPPSLYFFTASVRRGAYLSRRERHPLGAALFSWRMGRSWPRSRRCGWRPGRRSCAPGS